MEQTSELHSKQKPHTAGWIFGGISFIPLIGVIFGIIAIVYGVLRKSLGQIILGVLGILFTIAIYGSLFYFGFVAKTGPFAALKPQLNAQVMGMAAGQISLYKQEHNGQLPTDLNQLIATSTQSYMFDPDDAWQHPFKYTPNSNGSFVLTSAGPDGNFGTPDDISQSY